MSTNEDVFKYQAGVYAKAANNEGVKLSIRGSGLNRSPGAHASGLYDVRRLAAHRAWRYAL